MNSPRESKAYFRKGIGLYQNGQYQEALAPFSRALARGSGANRFAILDSRAAAYMKLGMFKKALADAKNTIDVAPERWQGYARAARVFHQLNKLDASLTMVQMAVARLKDGETGRRDSLLLLEAEIRQALMDTEAHRRRSTNQFLKLPVEIFSEIAKLSALQDPKTLISLLHVCGRWRGVILNNPSMWNVLTLTGRRPKEKAAFWVKQSRGAIRELHVQAKALESHGWAGEGLHRLQWDGLRICKVQKWDIVAYLQSISKTHILAQLDELEIDDVHLKYSLSRDSVFSEDLQLRRLAMTSTKLNVSKLTTHVRGLTYLALRFTSTHGKGLPDLLNANPLLETLILDYVGVDEVFSDVTLTMAQLYHLEVKGVAPRQVFYAHMPKLRILRLASLALPLDEHLKLLVNASDVHLEELSLRSCRFVENDPVIAILRNSPDLHTFEVSNIAYHANTIIECLAAPNPLSSQSISNSSEPYEPATVPPIFCPQLTHLNFSKCPDVTTGSIVRLIRSRLPAAKLPDPWPIYAAPRQPGAKRIVSLTIDGCVAIDHAWLTWMRQKVETVSCVYVSKQDKTGFPSNFGFNF
ncbi:hypothetical protein B0H34DRAFT_707467 [Crassisporium funariophilum]|nr:hypothetical protein B0H34DRAFT_707467 [Crassisporium funariophilum]